LILVVIFTGLNITQVTAQYSICQETRTVGFTYPEYEQIENPNIRVSGWQIKTGDGKVYVTAFVTNSENFGVYATLTAEITSEVFNIYRSSSLRTYFPPKQATQKIIPIEGINSVDYSYFSNEQYLRPNFFLTDFENVPVDTENKEPIDSDPFEETFEGEKRQESNISFYVDWPILGASIVAAVAVGAFVFSKQKKVSESHLRKVSLNEFQNWVVKRFSGKISSQRESTMGIDGHTGEGIPLLIKQSDNVGANVIDSFASVIGRQNARNGIVVAFSFNDDIYRGIVRAKRDYRIEIKKVTVKELTRRKPV
jgi:hypothetical protein